MKGKFLTIRAGAEDLEAWHQAAEAEGMELSAWVRRSLARKAEEEEQLRKLALTLRVARQTT